MNTLSISIITLGVISVLVRVLIFTEMSKILSNQIQTVGDANKNLINDYSLKCWRWCYSLTLLIVIILLYYGQLEL